MIRAMENGCNGVEKALYLVKENTLIKLVDWMSHLKSGGKRMMIFG